MQNANIDWSLLTKPSAIGPSFLLINGTFTTLRDSLKSDCYCKMHTYLQNRDFERVQRDSANWNDNGARAWHVVAGSQMLVSPRSKFRTLSLRKTSCRDFEDEKERQSEILPTIFILDQFGRPAGGDDQGLLNWKLVSAEE